MFPAKCYTWHALPKLPYTVTYCLQLIPFLATSKGKRNLRMVSAFDTPDTGQKVNSTHAFPTGQHSPGLFKQLPPAWKPPRLCQVSPPCTQALPFFRSRRKSRRSSILALFLHPWWRPANSLVLAVEFGEVGEGAIVTIVAALCVYVCLCGPT